MDMIHLIWNLTILIATVTCELQVAFNLLILVFIGCNMDKYRYSITFDKAYERLSVDCHIPAGKGIRIWQMPRCLM